MEAAINYIIYGFNNIRIQDIFDIAIITIIIYKLYNFLKQTRAEQLLKGIFLLLVLTKISEWLELYALNWILSSTMTVGAFAIIVVFQPELRRGLESLGRSRLLPKNAVDIRNMGLNTTVESIVSAVGSLARQKIGALIIIERETGLKDLIETGTIINGEVSAELLINIFIPNTPLHDGAVIIQNNTISAAGCFLPLSENMNIAKDMGTRHRAALGISEKSDCLAIVVSEETGTISLAENGEISRHLDIETLEQILMKNYKQEVSEGLLFNLWRNNNEDNGNNKKE